VGGAQAPEIQKMYSLDKPVAELRTKMRQEFERHRYVSQLPVVDVLLFQGQAEFQVGFVVMGGGEESRLYWKYLAIGGGLLEMCWRNGMGRMGFFPC
jgi:hypothetical protein